MIDRLLGYGRRMPRGQALAFVAAMLALTGIADGITGTKAWFGPVYLLIIAAGSWSLGARAGIVIGIACSAVSTSVNGVELYPLGAALIAWNYAMRFLAVALIVTLIGSIRRSYDREWLRARSDPMTGLLNRQGFYETVSARGLGAGSWSLLAYLDLDGLKQVNDRHGHAAGDTLLADFARNVAGGLGEEDLFARVGGDEFLLLIPVAGEVEGYEAARRLHARIGAQGCSIGALVRAPAGEPIGPRDVARSDALMYKAKMLGRGLEIAASVEIVSERETVPAQALAA